MLSTHRYAPRLLVVLVSLQIATMRVGAHDDSATVSDHGLGFGLVVVLTVVLGFLGGVVVLRWRRYIGSTHLSNLLVSLLIIVMGCVAVFLAVSEISILAVVPVVGGGAVTWILRNHGIGHHQHGYDQAALGVVFLHRFVEGAFLATIYASDLAVGIGTALILAAHTAAETGAVTGLWSAEKSRWAVIVGIQMGFITGAVGGVFVVRFFTPLVSVIILALLGGVLIVAGFTSAYSLTNPIHKSTQRLS